MSNIVNLTYPLIGSVVGWLIGTTAWHIGNYRRKRKLNKQRMWDILKQHDDY